MFFSQSSTATATSLGAIGMAVTGSVFYNDLSSPTGSLAMANEGVSLDACFGHSDMVILFLYCRAATWAMRLASSSLTMARQLFPSDRAETKFKISVGGIRLCLLL